jgi:GT2 family glycosyltransferase
MNKKTVCAVVVTYNREELLIECLESLLKQTRPLDGIYIIDNASTDGTPELLKEKGFIQELPPEDLSEPWEKEFKRDNLSIYYVRMHENTGGAGGFYEGVKRAYEIGYDWLWLMDDDAEPYENSLELLSQYFAKEDVVALANSVIKPDGEIDLKHRGLVNFNDMFPNVQHPLKLEKYSEKYAEIQTASFVGLLVSSKVIKKIGFPLKEFFIHNDDIEYCLRIIQEEKILLIPESKIKHKEASKTGIIKRVPIEKLWLQYYGRRNLIILANKYSTNKLNFYLKLFKQTVREIGGIILYDDYKIRRINFIINRVLDGIREIYDNDKPKRILYGKSTK